MRSWSLSVPWKANMRPVFSQYKSLLRSREMDPEVPSGAIALPLPSSPICGFSSQKGSQCVLSTESACHGDSSASVHHTIRHGG
jgi:hypothetical protein